jgi:hypothetical protein
MAASSKAQPCHGSSKAQSCHGSSKAQTLHAANSTNALLQWQPAGPGLNIPSRMPSTHFIGAGPTTHHSADHSHAAATLRYIEAGKAQGARLVAGGGSAAAAGGGRGYYVEPTVFADVSDDMGIARDEIFGPVQCICKWRELDEVIT